MSNRIERDGFFYSKVAKIFEAILWSVIVVGFAIIAIRNWDKIAQAIK